MKKTFAILLSVVLLFSALPFAALGAEKTCDCDKAPRIYINGINCCNLIKDAGTSDEKLAFSLSPEVILSFITDNKDVILDMLDGRIAPEREDKLVNAIINLFDDSSMDENGDSKFDISHDWFYATDDRHQLGISYPFSYDWRLDPYVLADQLHDYIEYIKDLTGHDTVHLVAHSLGTVVLDTYLSVYGTEGIESCVWYCGAYRGVSLVSQLFAGGLHVDPTCVTDFVHESTENSFGFDLLSTVLQGLKDIGVTSSLLGQINKAADQLCADGAFARVLRSSFGRMPALWAFVDDAHFEAAKNYIFPTAADRQTYAGLIERIDRYHYNVQARVDDIMEAARLATGHIGVVCKYNRHMPPAVPEGDISSDSMIDTFHTSGGATIAPLGKTLGDDYTQAVDDGHNHLSADGMVDASTCRYPEYTWFIRDMEHSQNAAYTDALFDFIAFSDHQVTVFENPAFPQFSVFNRNTGDTQPLTNGKDGNVNKKTVQKIHDFFQRILDYFRKLFTGALLKK